MSVDAGTLRAVVRECQEYLHSVPDADWTTLVPIMNGTVDRVAAHISTCLLWYSLDLSAGAAEQSTVDCRVSDDLSPAQLIATIGTVGSMLAAVVEAAAPDARGWHPAGRADPSGFAAMGCDELLVHTGDIGDGLGVPFKPSEDLAAATLHRLFPWAPADVDPWQGLLWANGRIALPGHAKLTSEWVWHCAPLSEWDGTVPRWTI